MKLEAGYQVTPQVRLVRLLRRGGMGAVWAAQHQGLGTEVAVKFMTGAFTEDDPMVQRFAREAAYTAQIKSPHVVHVYDHGMNADGLPFIVMELLDGEDLGDRVERLGTLSPLETAAIVSQVAKALTKAHQAGVVHRDIKLSNVFLLDVDGEIFAKLLDFGVALREARGGADLTTTGVMVGTLAYMSPEQLHNAKEVDHRTDLWSLAVVAYRALTGKLPFPDDSGVGALMLAVSRGRFAAPSSLRPGLPAALDGFFLRALDGEPARRFPTARDFSDALDLAVGRTSAGVRTSDSGVGHARAPLPTVIDPSGVGRLPQSTASGRRVDASTSAGVVRSESFGGAEPRARRSRVPAVIGALALLGAAAGAAIYFVPARDVASPTPGASRPEAPLAAPSAANVAPPAPVPVVEPAPAASGGAAVTSAPAEASAAAALPSAPPASAPPASAPPANTSTPPTSAARPQADPKPTAAPPPAPPRPGATRPREKDYGF